MHGGVQKCHMRGSISITKTKITGRNVGGGEPYFFGVLDNGARKQKDFYEIFGCG
jgi:hypothetical protein